MDHLAKDHLIIGSTLTYKNRSREVAQLSGTMESVNLLPVFLLVVLVIIEIILKL